MVADNRNAEQAVERTATRVGWKVTVERISTTTDCGDAYCGCQSHRKRISWIFYPTALSLESAGIRYEIRGDVLATVLGGSQPYTPRSPVPGGTDIL